MALQLVQEASNSFIKGLITEASPMTFPKDASVDEANCELLKNGGRRRRKGVALEPNYVNAPYTTRSTDLWKTGVWDNVGNSAGVNFLVIQHKYRLIFYQITGDPISSQRVPTSYTDSTPYVVNLRSHEKPTGTGAWNAEVSLTSINGALVVVSPEIEPFYITRDTDTGVFTITSINFKIRDFSWQGDRADYTEPVSNTEITAGRQYDTKNSGWADGPSDIGDAALNTYQSQRSGNWPPLTHPWFSSKNADGNFDVSQWEKIYSGTSIIANGHYILDLFNRDRGTASGVAGLPVESESARFSTTTTFSGRVWYAGLTNSTTNLDSNIYFSQLLYDDFTAIGSCYQQNDPTAESISDLLPTDGGYITISGAYNIKELYVTGAKLLVFAENGVWSIGGVDDVFKANEYVVTKESSIGIEYKDSFIGARGKPFWWNTEGIYTFDVSKEFGTLVEQNITEGTIQSHWDAISLPAKEAVKAVFDGKNNIILWMYPDNSESNPNKRNNILLLDLTLSAFYPWTISDQATDTSYIIDGFYFDGIASEETTADVYDNEDAVLDGAEQIIADTLAPTYYSAQVKLIVADGATDTMTFAGFTDTDFLDWGETSYTSYAETYYNFLGDVATKKNIVYVYSLFKLTETGWTGNETTGYTPVNESSCLLSTYWDLNRTVSAPAQQAYRFNRLPVVDTSDLSSFNYPTDMIISKLRQRGRGRVMRLRYASEAGKDFYLYGYEVVSGKSTAL